uniref:Uncharacterized protein n=1 Tax=Rousettus aegyptiacus TaxID=9407 RepID=A0A7J8BAR2_ROUAE|nr:hypothetical protein HJG63_009966 [Rousettus aegyptiacus]
MNPPHETTRRKNMCSSARTTKPNTTSPIRTRTRTRAQHVTYLDTHTHARTARHAFGHTHARTHVTHAGAGAHNTSRIRTRTRAQHVTDSDTHTHARTRSYVTRIRSSKTKSRRDKIYEHNQG